MLSAELKTEIKRTLKLAAPIMFAQFLVFSMTLVDNVMVGRLGKIELGGLALASGFYNFVTIIVIGILSALSPLISGAVGGGDKLRGAAYLRQGMMLAGLISVALLPLLWFSESILLMTGQQANTSAVGAEYLRAMMWSMTPNLLFLATRIFAEATDDAMPSLFLAGCAAAINIPLDWMLIHGHWGAPALGVAGAGYATAILYWMSLIAILIYFAISKRYRPFRVFNESWRPNFGIWKEVARLGVPLAGAIGTEMGFFVATTFLMGRIGEVELAAHQVAINASATMFMFPLGLSFAVGVRVGNNMGRNDVNGARTAWLASLVITGVVALIGMVIFLTIPHLIVDLYDQKENVRELAIRLLMISGLFQLFDGFQVVGMGGLRGLRKGGFALAATTFSFWIIGIGAVYYFYTIRWPVGIWIGLLIGLFVASIIHHSKIHSVLRET